MLQLQKKAADNSLSSPKKHNVQSLSAIAGNQSVLNVLHVGMKPIQRIVAAWSNLILPANTHVYHGTTQLNADNIIEHGILPVQNGFGGGQLGPGFYTYTTPSKLNCLDTLFYTLLQRENCMVKKFLLVRIGLTSPKMQ